MKLVCHIGTLPQDSVFPLVQGFTFTDEYSEKLDSGSIIISVQPQLDIKPYDDVIIWDAEIDGNIFKGYGENVTYNGFYKHFLIQNFVEEPVYMGEHTNGGILTAVFKYKIELCSETAKLDKIVLPNISITQPLILSKKKSVYEYLKQYLELYSPKIKRFLNAARYNETTSLWPGATQGIYVQNFDDYNFFTFDLKMYSTNEWIGETSITYENGSFVNNMTIIKPVVSVNIDPDDDSTKYLVITNNNPYSVVAKFRTGVDGVNWEEPKTIDIPANSSYSELVFYSSFDTEVYFSNSENVSKVVSLSRNDVMKDPIITIEDFSADFKLISVKNNNNFNVVISYLITVNYSDLDKDIYNYKNKSYFYDNKYKIDENSFNEFKTLYSPEFTLNGPTFRELFSQLMQVNDCIPYVKDDVIYSLKIGDVKKDENDNPVYFDNTKGKINYINSSMTNTDYCTNLRTNYSDALAQEYSGSSIENIGFRNSDKSLLTLDNMRLELNFPIYKINHVYMYYYKKFNYVKKVKNSSGIYVLNYDDSDNVLVEQDITDLIKLTSEREALKQDWSDLRADKMPGTIEEGSKYRFFTIGYSQGSNVITGWGEKINFPIGPFFDTSHATVLELILKLVDYNFPFGTKGMHYYLDKKNESSGQEKYINISVSLMKNATNTDGFTESIIRNFFGSWEAGYSLTNFSDILKSITFKIDYQPFYSGTIVHSKGFGDVAEAITSPDNPNHSLCLLERDGVAQREKLERFGNRSVVIQAKYTDINDVQDIGVYFNTPYANDNINKDIIIYHREVSYFDNVINVTYYGAKDYVLKNYFTSVFAKYRTNALMPYSESVRRAENLKYYFYLHFDDINVNDVQEGFEEVEKCLISSFYPNNGHLNNIKNAYYKTKYWKYVEEGEYEESENEATFVSDLQVVCSGNSVILNTSMRDNIIAGVYVDASTQEVTWFDNTKDDIIGNMQTQYFLTTPQKNGIIEDMKFGFTTSNSCTSEDDIDIFKEYAKRLPIVHSSSFPFDGSITIETDNKINKDNKEIIDFSLQFEYIPGKNIFISPWFAMLNDLTTKFYKQTEKKLVIDDAISGWSSKLRFYCGFESPDGNETTDIARNHFGSTLTPSVQASKVWKILENKNTYFGYSYDSSNNYTLYDMQKDFATQITGSSNDGKLMLFYNPTLVISIAESIYNSAARVQYVNLKDCVFEYEGVYTEIENFASIYGNGCANPYWKAGYECVTSMRIEARRLFLNQSMDSSSTNGRQVGNLSCLITYTTSRGRTVGPFSDQISLFKNTRYNNGSYNNSNNQLDNYDGSDHHIYLTSTIRFIGGFNPFQLSMVPKAMKEETAGISNWLSCTSAGAVNSFQGYGDNLENTSFKSDFQNGSTSKLIEKINVAFESMYKEVFDYQITDVDGFNTFTEYNYSKGLSTLRNIYIIYSNETLTQDFKYKKFVIGENDITDDVVLTREDKKIIIDISGFDDQAKRSEMKSFIILYKADSSATLGKITSRNSEQYEYKFVFGFNIDNVNQNIYELKGDLLQSRDMKIFNKDNILINKEDLD